MAETKDNWAKLPLKLRKRAVAHLRKVCQPEVLEWVRAKYEEDPEVWYAHDMTKPEERERLRKENGFYIPSPFHWTTGMAVRNALRDVITDDELPPVLYESGLEHRNWDDYYAEALEVAAGLRDIDE